MTLSRRWSGEEGEMMKRRRKRGRGNLTGGVSSFEEGRGNSRAMCPGAFQHILLKWQSYALKTDMNRIKWEIKLDQ